MIVFGGASIGAVLKLRCPSCKEVQARARAPEGTVYVCRACGHSFTREEGTPDQGTAEAATAEPATKRDT